MPVFESIPHRIEAVQFKLDVAYPVGVCTGGSDCDPAIDFGDTFPCSAPHVHTEEWRVRQLNDGDWILPVDGTDQYFDVMSNAYREENYRLIVTPESIGMVVDGMLVRKR